MAKLTSTIVVDARKIIEALRTCMDIPQTTTELLLHLKVDEIPVITCTFHPVSNAG